MKYIYIFIIAIVGLFIVGCNPMSDINEELDQKAEQDYIRDTFIFNREIAPDAYTLTDEDYELSSDEGVAKYKNFSEYALPKDYLPEILNKKFTASDAFAMNVTYNFYSKPVVDEEAAYIIDTAEYEEMGQSKPNFGDEDEAENLIGKMLDRKIYATEAGAEMTVMYTLYSTNEDRYITVKEDTVEVLKYAPDEYYTLDTTDYADLGEGKYDNFYTIEVAQEKLVEFAQLREHVLPKSYECLVYKNYFDTYVVYMYNGSNWVAKQSNMPRTEPLNYKLEEDITQSTWWADPAIKITLTSADYDIHTETSKYKNFDLRSGSTPGTSEDKLVEMLGVILETNYEPIDDQQYLVYYAYYDGANGVGATRMIRTAGVWEKYTE